MGPRNPTEQPPFGNVADRIPEGLPILFLIPDIATLKERHQQTNAWVEDFANASLFCLHWAISFSRNNYACSGLETNFWVFSWGNDLFSRCNNLLFYFNRIGAISPYS